MSAAATSVLPEPADWQACSHALLLVQEVMLHQYRMSVWEQDARLSQHVIALHAAIESYMLAAKRAQAGAP